MIGNAAMSLDGSRILLSGERGDEINPLCH